MNPFSTNTYYDIVQCKVGDTVTYSKTTPTKAADSQYTYKFSGWNTVKDSTANTGILTNVESSMVLYPQFVKDTPIYTVTWKNIDGTTLKTEYVERGSTPKYSGSTPSFNSWSFTGWSPTPSSLSGPMTYYALYSFPNGMTDTMAKDWSTVISDSNANNTSGYSTGKTKVMIMTDKQPLCYELAKINLDSAEHFAFIARTTAGNTKWNNSNSNTNGYPSSVYKTYLEGTVLNKFPANIKNALKSVTKYCYCSYPKNANLSYTAKVWPPNMSNFNCPGYETSEPRYYYYDSNSKRIRYDGSGTAVIAWLSSAYGSSTVSACYISTDGSDSHGNCSGSYGALPCFVL